MNAEKKALTTSTLLKKRKVEHRKQNLKISKPL